MKKIFVIALVFVAAVSVSTTLHAQATHEGHSAKATAMATTTTSTLQGELVDMGCYLGMGAKGADHRSCALKCISGGMPMGLLTADGKLYLLTESHDSADPYIAAKAMAADQITVTGQVFEKDGIKAIEVKEIKDLTTAQQKSAKGTKG